MKIKQIVLTALSMIVMTGGMTLANGEAAQADPRTDQDTMGTYKTIEQTAKLYKDFNLLYVTSTTGGGHARGSYHYRGCAVDFGSGVRNAGEVSAAKTNRWAVMDNFARWLYGYSGNLTEEIHTQNKSGSYPGGWYVKNGSRVSKSYYGYSTVQAHKDHVHVAVATNHSAEVLFTKVVQGTLVKLGYKNVKVDGDNGPITKAAVKDFQKKHPPLKVDGIVGDHTINAMRAALKYKPL